MILMTKKRPWLVIARIAVLLLAVAFALFTERRVARFQVRPPETITLSDARSAADAVRRLGLEPRRVPPTAAVDIDRPGLPTDIRTALDAGDFDERELAFSHAVVLWTKDHPEGAAKLSIEMGPRSEEIRLRLSAHARANKDFLDAYHWASSTTLPSAAIASVLYQAAADAPQLVLEVAQAAPLDERKPIVLKNILLQWAQDDFASAVAWMLRQPINVWRNEMIQELATSRFESQPAQAAELIATALPLGSKQEQAISRILQSPPLRDDADAALNWISLFPSGRAREFALHQFCVIYR